MELRESGESVEGTIDGLTVTGVRRNDSANGDLISADGTIDFGDWSVVAIGDALDVNMTVTNPETGETYTVPTIRCARSTPPSNTSRDTNATSELDPNLVGAWRHTHTYASNGFTGVIDDYLWLNADGSYREGGNAAAGGESGGVVTGPGDRGDGRWKSVDRVLYVMPEGSGDWQIWTAYAADGQNLMFKFDSGRNKIWSRM